MVSLLRVLLVRGLLVNLVACGGDTSGTRPRRATGDSGSDGVAGAGPGVAGAPGQASSTGEAGTEGATLTEPIEYDGLNGLARNPIVSHVFTADPSAHTFEGRIYVYASHDLDEQTDYEMHDYHVFSSDDLVNWQDHGVALDAADISWSNRLYAPDCAYSEATGRYYLYFPNSGSGIGVAVSDSPAGPFVDALGEALIDRNTPGVEDVEWVFDPMCFVDDDGQAYLYFGGGMQDTGDNARVIRLNEDMVSLADDAATTIVAPDFFEASFMHKRDGKYYFSYSTTFADHSAYIDYLVSDDPMTGFEYAGTILRNPTGNNYNNHHHSIVQYEGDWYIFYHNRVLANRDGYSDYQRSITLDHLLYDADGTIEQVSATMGEVAQLRNLDAFSRLEAESMADQRGIEVDSAQDGGSRVGVTVTDLHDRDWIGYSQVDFGAGATSFRARVAAGSDSGGTIHIYVDGCDMFTNLPGLLVGTCLVEATGGWQNWTSVQCSIEPTDGVHDVYLRFAGAGSAALLSLDSFQFE
jgi:arabinoxylan arabinofuranohydrolase